VLYRYIGDTICLEVKQVRQGSMLAIAIDMARDLAGSACKIDRVHVIS
jgi:hypothetical protein